ncbi:hypothetical protein [Sphingosinicella sp.]|uniref:hypothetical protein n=1 Tax=Sphingosinicella sp. TaxID=1917971 RepID=UPI0040376030
MPKRFSLRRRRSPRIIYLPAEPGAVRHVPRRMVSPASLIALGAGGVVAVIFGVSLGNSAISQINPLYFQGAALHPRDRGTAVDPNAPTVIPNRYEQLYGFTQGQRARAVDCVGCTFAPPAMPTEAGVYAASAPYFGSREERARDEARERQAIDAGYLQRLEDAAARRAALEEVRRYSSYRVSEDEVVRERPAAENRERPFYARNDVVLTDDSDDGK